MKKEHKRIVENFERHARPVDMVNHIDNLEIMNLIREVHKELKNLNVNNE
jgi:hypothetical protein